MNNSNHIPNYRGPLAVLTVLFFMWGLITSLNDILVPHLKAVFTLSYVQASLIQFCFFTAYFIVSFPAGRLVESLGYKKGIILGLCTAAVGCLLFYPAAGAHSYTFFLLALFILAGGITILQVAANPYVTILGKPETAASRLTLTQAFNSLGTTVGPLIGAVTILALVEHSTDASSVQMPYLILAGMLLVIAIIIGLIKLPQIKGGNEEVQTNSAAPHQEAKSIWQHKHLLLGVVGIFMYVGAEVSVGTYLISLMESPEVAGLTSSAAGQYLALYWGGAMVGRFVGGVIMAKVKPSHVLAFNSIANVILIGLAIAMSGKFAMWALLCVGLFNSIMFPTIFSLALDGLGKFTSKGSGLLCMGIVGGALLPLIQAIFADSIGLLTSFFVPMIGYLYILFYGLKGYRVQPLNTH
ncbi:FHS family L-fucose permease-like MFS transporter [Pseudomonas duriflava]|uniref:FHS family L-fucose permease-like MFS transporter n=1 Tax=Pseudomonas duriflava TaxID=459528 RepID=A0A562Q9T4_9PSED|nr:sugar MFS transporter [Pseudomonas duriflava]TWI53522.1 FHS family L-fucose permease-like MFS transporter [Pseudomonas duriflava]